MGEACDDLKSEAAGLDVQALAGLLADLTEEFGVFDNVGMNDGAGGSRQAFEGIAELVSAAGALFGLGGERGRRWNVGFCGGFGLFFLALEELQEELVGAELFAFGSVEALEKGGDNAILDLKLGLKRAYLFT